MTFDLSAYEAAADAQESGVVVDLVDPVTGEAVGATITVVGPDSRKARRARRDAIRAVTQGGGELDTMDLGTQMLARCIVGWTGLRWGGEDLPLSAENALRVLERFPWIEAQIDRKASDRRNFAAG